MYAWIRAHTHTHTRYSTLERQMPGRSTHSHTYANAANEQQNQWDTSAAEPKGKVFIRLPNSPARLLIEK